MVHTIVVPWMPMPIALSFFHLRMVVLLQVLSPRRLCSNVNDFHGTSNEQQQQYYYYYEWMDGVGRRTGCDFDGHGELSASEAAVRKGKETLWQQNQVTQGLTLRSGEPAADTSWPLSLLSTFK